MNDYELARTMGCPMCAARPGEPCINANGTKMWMLHPPRWRVAKEAKRSSTACRAGSA
ncbi:zinc finger domain-containing protein [Mycobacterium sp.]|uniref:zinc finger domain-containing protein n=1 Tax=Mycobacterium sp. TaxID=1785 RepID=UPI003F7F4C09